jgi:hypothetical protein
MPKLARISYRELRRKLRQAGYLEIRTSKHPVYYLAEMNITIRSPIIPAMCRSVPSGRLSGR